MSKNEYHLFDLEKTLKQHYLKRFILILGLCLEYAIQYCICYCIKVSLEAQDMCKYFLWYDICGANMPQLIRYMIYTRCPMHLLHIKHTVQWLAKTQHAKTRYTVIHGTSAKKWATLGWDAHVKCVLSGIHWQPRGCNCNVTALHLTPDLCCMSASLTVKLLNKKIEK